jgi:hypothetical protein
VLVPVDENRRFSSRNQFECSVREITGMHFLAHATTRLKSRIPFALDRPVISWTHRRSLHSVSPRSETAAPRFRQFSRQLSRLEWRVFRETQKNGTDYYLVAEVHVAAPSRANTPEGDAGSRFSKPFSSKR